MFNILHLKRQNQWIIFTMIILLSLILTAYLLTLYSSTEGYNPELYKKAYMGFFLLQFVMFTIFVPFFSLEGRSKRSALGVIWSLCIFSLSTIPLLLTIFSAGGINGVSLFIPLVLQTIWGGAVLYLKKLIKCFRLDKSAGGFIVAIFIFITIGISLALLYVYIYHSQAVITTIFDKDIPIVFFINPILTIAGFLYVQIGGSTQMGLFPVIFCASFWSVFGAIMGISAQKLTKKGQSADEE